MIPHLAHQPVPASPATREQAASDELGDQSAPEANRDGVGARPRLQLGEQVSHVGFHRLFREEEAMADLPIDEALRNQVEDLDLTGCRLLFELLERRGEGDDLAGAARGPPLGDGLEAPRMVHVSRQDLFTLGSVHEPGIGGLWTWLTPPLE
jgi:hypothetical protein